MNARTADFAATAPWAGIINKPSGFAPAPHAPTHGKNGNDPVHISIEQVVGLLEILLSKVDKSLEINGHPLTHSFSISASDLPPGGTMRAMTFLLTRVLGLADPSRQFNLFLDFSVTPAQDLTLHLSLNADRTLTLNADLRTAGGNPIIISSNGNDRLVDLEADLILNGDGTHRLIFELGADDRTITLEADLSVLGGKLTTQLDGDYVLSLLGGGVAFSVDADTVVNLHGDVTIAGPLITIGSYIVILTFTGVTTVTFPTTGTLVTLDGAETLTNKTLDAPQINSPTGLTQSDVGLSQVDNTSDVNKPVSTAQAAADATKQPLTGNSFAVAGLPAAGSNVGRVVYCTNGNAGSPCAAISDGSNWKVVAIGATVSP